VKSLAFQLAKHSPVLARMISAAVNADPGLKTNKNASDIQWTELVAKPLASLFKAKGTVTVVLVIDGLDECKNMADAEEILGVWPSLNPALCASCCRASL
jgi:hypothetical protein